VVCCGRGVLCRRHVDTERTRPHLEFVVCQFSKCVTRRRCRRSRWISKNGRSHRRFVHGTSGEACTDGRIIRRAGQLGNGWPMRFVGCGRTPGANEQDGKSPWPGFACDHLSILSWRAREYRQLCQCQEKLRSRTYTATRAKWRPETHLQMCADPY
jgi:hypothetical protein